MAGSSCLGRWDLFERGLQNKSRVTNGANATSYKKASPETAERRHSVGNQINTETLYQIVLTNANVACLSWQNSCA